MRHRPFHMLHGARQRIGEFVATDPDFMVIEPVALDHQLAILALVVGMIAETDGIGSDAPAGGAACERRDQAGIDAARQLQRIADIAHQVLVHRGFDCRLRARFRHVRRDAGIRLQRIEHVAEAPPLDRPALQRNGEQRAAGHALDALHIAERTRRPGEGEQFGQRCIVDTRLAEAKQRPHLARKADGLPALREIKRLDAERIACRDANAAHPVDQHKGIHAFQPVEHARRPIADSPAG